MSLFLRWYIAVQTYFAHETFCISNLGELSLSFYASNFCGCKLSAASVSESKFLLRVLSKSRILHNVNGQALDSVL